MTAEELAAAVEKDPESAVQAAMQAIEEQRARAEAEAQEKAAILRNKTEILAELRKRKDLGTEEEILKWRAIAEEAAARKDAEGEPGAKDDDEPEALKLAARKWEAERDLMKRRHQEEVERIAAEKTAKETEALQLQRRIDRGEIEAILRGAAKGRVQDDAVEHLANKLEQCFRKESDGTWTLYNPKTDLPMKSPAGGPMTFEELVEGAMLSQGSDPWSKGLAFCFKPPEGGEGGRPGPGRVVHDFGKMSKDDKIKFVEKYGADKFGEAVSKTTLQRALEATQAASERRSRMPAG